MSLIPKPAIACQQTPVHEIRCRERSLRPIKEKPPGGCQPHSSPEPDDDLDTDCLEGIFCRQCRHIITFPSEVRIVGGSHLHSFANPQGIVYEIGCYNHAVGCGYVGPPSMEFTWFSGYSWRIAICNRCQVHLGWRFSNADGHMFHGLITGRLTEGQQ